MKQKKRPIRQGLIMATAFAMLLQPGLIHFNFENVAEAAAVASISNKVVSLGANSNLIIRDAKLLMQDKGLVLAYTVTITNNGSNSIDIMDYWLRVKGSKGKIFKSALTDADKDVKSVAPKTSINLTYFATVDISTKLGDLTFDVLKWDFSVPNYERVLGSVKYPSTSSGKTPSYQPSVMLFNNTKIKGALKQYVVTQDQSTVYLNMSFLLENVGYSSASLANLGFSIQTDSNSVFDVNASSITQTTLQPKERKIITIQAKLPTALLNKSVALIPYTKDETNKIKLPNGSFAIPVLKPSGPAPAGKTKTIYMDGQQVQTVTGNAILNDNDGSTDLSMDFTLNNVGTTALTLPGLDFALRTKNGVSYPLTYTPEDQATLLPRISKSINLSGKIPSNIDKTSVQLVVKTKATEGQEGYLIGTYYIQASSQQGNVGSSLTYNTDYSVKLKSIQRTPLEDSDMLVANLTITNKSKFAKNIPSTLSGYFLINGVKVESEHTATGLDQTINIAPNGEYHTVVYTKVPYTTTVDDISFILTENVKDKPVKNLFQFSGQTVNAIPVYSTANKYQINNIGGKAAVKVLNTNIFTSDNASYFYSEFEATNLEARSAQLVNLGAYLEDDAGRIVQVNISQAKDKITSSGKVLVSAWGLVGKNFNLKNYKLIFGQAVKSAAATPEAQQLLIVDPVSYAIINKGTTINTNLNNIHFSQYTLSLNNVQSNLSVTGMFNVEGVKLNMDYDLSVDNTYDYATGDHKLIFEFVDQENSKATYSKEFTIDKANDAGTLKSGTSIPLEIVYNDPEIQQKVRNYTSYKLNIYDSIDNAKVLIASKEIKWFGRE